MASFTFFLFGGLLMAPIWNPADAQPVTERIFISPTQYRTSAIFLVPLPKFNESTSTRLVNVDISATTPGEQAQRADENDRDQLTESNDTASSLDANAMTSREKTSQIDHLEPPNHNTSSSQNTLHAQNIHPHFHGPYHTRIVVLDLDLILASRRLVHNYVGCLIDVRPCTHEGDELKKILPDALETQCSKCSPRQKVGAKKVITTLQTRYPEEWLILRKKWDLGRLKGVIY